MGVGTAITMKLDSLITFAKNLKSNECTGLLVTTQICGSVACHKLVPDEYTKARSIRGNEPNLRLRYLQFRCGDGDSDGLTALRNLYLEKAVLFDDVEKDYECLRGYLESKYVYRYQKRNYLLLPREEYYLLETTHRKYNPEITLAQNLQIRLITSNARQLNAMIKHMKEENKK